MGEPGKRWRGCNEQWGERERIHVARKVSAPVKKMFCPLFDWQHNRLRTKFMVHSRFKHSWKIFATTETFFFLDTFLSITQCPATESTLNIVCFILTLCTLALLRRKCTNAAWRQRRNHAECWPDGGEKNSRVFQQRHFCCSFKWVSPHSKLNKCVLESKCRRVCVCVKYISIMFHTLIGLGPACKRHAEATQSHNWCWLAVKGCRNTPLSLHSSFTIAGALSNQTHNTHLNETLSSYLCTYSCLALLGATGSHHCCCHGGAMSSWETEGGGGTNFRQTKQAEAARTRRRRRLPPH